MKKIICLVLALIVIAAWLAVFSYQRLLAQPGPNPAAQQFTIKSGQSVRQISRQLAAAGILRLPWLFQAYVWRHNLEKKLQAGQYQIPARASIRQLTEIFAQGKVVNKEVTIKIIEGWRLSQMADYLKNQGLVSAADFLPLAKMASSGLETKLYQDFPFLADKPAGASLEGYLFPDTYRVYQDADGQDIIYKMLANFGQKVNKDLLAAIQQQKKSLYQVITLASIIEKEVRDPEDMKIVAGIFTKRLKRGQPLESCATLAYILGVNKRQYSLADTKVPSPYNTYLHPGLPPGPICNPGLAAIKAAVWPQETEYNYFLTNPADGQTIFSRTYQEHLRNKAKYLK